MTLDKTTGYWMFICNPKIWAIDEFLTTSFTQNSKFKITDHHKDYVRPGNLGVIRVGTDGRNKSQRNGRPRLQPGVYAIVQILSEPQRRGELEEAHLWSSNEIDRSDDLVVDIKYVANLIENPVLVSELENISEIDEHLITNRQASSWPIEKRTFEIIEQLTNQKNNEYPLQLPIVDTILDIQKASVELKNAVPQVRSRVVKTIERGSIGEKVKKYNDYKCQVCEALGYNPCSFKKPNGECYVEAHHVEPVSSGKVGVLSAENIITVCANHHRQMHYGNVELIKDTNYYFVFHIDNHEITIPKIRI